MGSSAIEVILIFVRTLYAERISNVVTVSLLPQGRNTKGSDQKSSDLASEDFRFIRKSIMLTQQILANVPRYFTKKSTRYK